MSDWTIMRIFIILMCSVLNFTMSYDFCERCECSSEILDCRHISVPEIEDGTYFPSSIQRVFISDTGLQHFHPSTLNVTNSDARLLELSANNLQNIDGQTFEEFPKLRKLRLKNNKISSIKNNSFKSLNHLTHLDLSYNRIPHLPQDMLIHLQNLTHLSLKYNSIKEIPLGLLRESQKLNDLNLSYLMISDLEEEAFNWNLTIQKLDLSHNFLSFIPSGLFQKIGAHVTEIHLSGNLFTTIPQFAFRGGKVLQTIILDQLLHLKRIEEHAFSSLDNLQTVQLRYLPVLESIDKKAFHLSIGNGNDTVIHHVPICDFTLSFTTLSTLSPHLLNWTHLRLIELVHNRWSCNCDMAWVKNTSIEDLTGNSMVCSEPSSLRGENIRSLKREDMVCIPDDISTVPHGSVGVILFLCFVAFLLGIATVGILFYRDNGWIVKAPVTFRRLSSQDSSITVYDREESDLQELSRRNTVVIND